MGPRASSPCFVSSRSANSHFNDSGLELDFHFIFLLCEMNIFYFLFVYFLYFGTKMFYARTRPESAARRLRVVRDYEQLDVAWLQHQGKHCPQQAAGDAGSVEHDTVYEALLQHCLGVEVNAQAEHVGGDIHAEERQEDVVAQAEDQHVPAGAPC